MVAPGSRLVLGAVCPLSTLCFRTRRSVCGTREGGDCLTEPVVGVGGWTPHCCSTGPTREREGEREGERERERERKRGGGRRLCPGRRAGEPQESRGGLLGSHPTASAPLGHSLRVIYLVRSTCHAISDQGLVDPSHSPSRHSPTGAHGGTRE